MTPFRRRIGSSLLAACTVLAVACADSVTAPITPVAEGLSGTLSFGDSIFTRGVPVRATFTPPAGYKVVPGSVTWSAPTGAATVLPLAGTYQADVTFTAAGAAQISAAYTITRDGASSSLSAAAPTLRTSGAALSTAARSVSVSAPTLAFAVKPTATTTASATLGNVRVELRDARGRAITTAGDSVSIKLDPTSGTSGAVLLGAATAPAVSGVASFNSLAIRRVGTAYRLIASSATVQKTDTALVSITAGAPNAAASTLALSRTTTAAGDTLTVSVTVRDEYGNIVLDATPAALAGTSSGGVVGAFTCRSGICTATYTSPLLAGTPTVAVTIGGANVGGSPATVTVNAGAPARFVIVGATSQVAGTAQTITIRALDAFGNIAVGYTGAKALSFSGALVAPIGTNPTVSSTPFGSGATITFVNGIATASMTLVGAGSNVVAATDGAVTTSGPDRLAVAVVHNVSSPAQTIVTLSPAAVAPGGAVTVTVTIRDAWGNPVLNATPDLLQGTPGGGTLGAFTCVSGVCTASYVAPNTAGPYPLPFTLGGQPLPPPTVTVVAGVPARLVITGSSTQVAGTTQTITLRALDAAGNVATNYTGVKSLLFSGASSAPSGAVPDVGGLRFGTATVVTFVNGVASVPLRLFAAETATIAATDGTVSSTGADRLTVVVSAGTAARLAVLGASTQPAGSTQSMLIVASDSWGNRARSYTGAKSLTFSGAAVAGGSNAPLVGATAFGTATSVTFVNGAAANVPMTLYAVETAVIAATDGTISATGTSRLSVVVTAGAVSASTSTLALSASTLTPGQQVTVTVTLRDASGNIVTSANASSFSGAVSGGMLGSWSCTNGVCTATYTAPLVAGGQTISAQIGGTDIVNSPAAVTVVPGAASRFVITGAASQNAGASQNITIRALDAYGNIATGYTGAKNLTFSGATASPASNAPTASATAFGTTTSVTFTAGEATGVALVLYKTETAVIAATDGSVSATGADRLDVTVAAAAASAAQSTLAVSPTSLAPSGTATATVTVKDAYGNVITNATSSAFSASASGGSLGAFNCTLGVCTATYTAPILAGAKTISATIGGTDIGNSPATVTVTAGAAARFVILGAATQNAGASQNITIRALDANGNIAVAYTGAKNLTFSGASASPASNDPTASATAFGTTTAVTFTAGEATGVALVLYKAETAVIAATDGSVSATGADRLDVTVSAGVSSRFVITGAASQTAGASQNITIRALDAYGNVAVSYAGAKNLTFSGANASPASNAPTASATAFGTTTSVTFTAGEATSVPMVLYKSETAVIAATDGSVSATGADRLSVTVAAAAASAAQSTLAVSPTSLAPSGTATATVTVKDAYGNVVTNATSSAFSTSTSGGSLGAFSCTAGVCTATYTAPILAGAKTISATIGGTDIGNSPATVTVTAGAAARFVIFGAATQNAGASQNITIRALDANGNIATGYTGAKNLTFSGANASPASNAPTASATAFGTTTAVTFTAGEATGVALVLFKAETAVIAATDGSVSATGADRLDVTVAAVAASAAQSTLSVSPTTVAASGTATATVTVRDAYGNVITNATSSAFATSTSGGSLGSFSCTAGVCTATYTAPILAGAKTISATIGGTDIGNSPATVTVTAGAAARFVILGAATQVAGASQNITIRALDANGNIATSYTGAKTLTFSGASVSANSNAPTIVSTAFGTGTSVTFASGEATLVAMTLYTAETAVVATTDGSVSATSTDRLTVTVSADNASPVVTDITAAPTSIVANGTSESTLSITLKDDYGNATTTVASPGTVALVKTTGTGTLLGSLTNAGGGVYTQQVQSPASAGSGTFAATLNGTQTTNTATVTYESAGGVLSRVVCTTSQPAGQSAASSATVNLCPNASAGDLEVVTLALDGTDDLSAPATGGLDGTWVKIASELQTTGSGGNKPMLLILYARRYVAGYNRVVTFTAGTNHKWSVDMVTLQSSGVALPSAADVSVANNSTGAALSIASPFTATADNTVLYHVFANSGTGATATITPNTSLTTLGTNNTGGTSSLSFLEIVANTVTAPTRTFTSSVSANSVLIRLVVRP